MAGVLADEEEASTPPHASKQLIGHAISPCVLPDLLGSEVLSSLLDSVEHFSFHDERCRLHWKHANLRGQ